MGDGGKAQGRQGHPRRPAVHAHLGDLRTSTSRSGPAPTSCFLGALINHVLSNELWFKEYVVAYTNAATLVNEDFRDTEDLGGLFSGYDDEPGSYDPTTWAYATEDGGASPGTIGGPAATHEHGDSKSERAAGDEHGTGGPALEHARVMRDETLQDPRTVFQILKRHYARYTPEMVADVCGISVDDFEYLAKAVTENSGRERTTGFVYAVGWTQHTLGAQFIRTAAILQLLLGNVGRPGGGIMALRGHASIQGSTDIPTLFNLLPGYLPMPMAGRTTPWDEYIDAIGTKKQKGFWANADAYAVSLLKAWWGDAATADNDWAYDYLPRLTGAHGTYQTVMAMLDDEVEGYFLLGQNPAVGSAHGRMQRLGMSHLKWLVVRDLNMIESATFWKDGPEIASGELRTEDIETEVFFLPAATHVEKAGSFTQTQRLLQWRHKAVEPPGDCQSELQFFFELGKRIRAKLADSTDERDRPLLDLTWDYPDGRARRARRGGGAAGDQRPPPDRRRGRRAARALHRAARRRVHLRRLLDLHRRLRGRRQPRRQPQARPRAGPHRARVGLGLAGQPPDPLQPRLGRPGRQAVERAQELRLVGRGAAEVGGRRRPRLRADQAALRTGRTRTRAARPRLAGDDPFIMQADGKGWLFAPKGMVDGPLPTHYEPQESPVAQPALPAAAEPGADGVPAQGQPVEPVGRRTRVPTSTPTSSPPTGSPSTTPRAA